MMSISRKKHRTTESLKIFIWLLWVLLCCNSLVFGAQQASSPIDQKIFKLIRNGSVMLNDSTGQILLRYQEKRSLIPASIIKILTSQAAIEILGENYRFKTDFYLLPNQSLLIKGWGDPFLISEEIILIAKALKEKGHTRFQALYLDRSAFPKKPVVQGVSNSLNPYDALNGALVVNFNSLYIGKRKDGTIYSAEDVTPLTPLARQKGQYIKRGTRDRINLTRSPGESLQYVGELFHEIFKNEGIRFVSNKVKELTRKQQGRLIYSHYNSKPLPFALKGLLRYSNNFIANQIFLTAGSQMFEYPASMKKGNQAFVDFVRKKYRFPRGEFQIDEASGISKQNRLSARVMMTILESFRPYADLLHLKKGAYSKSGTLTGVYNYAGYIKRGDRLFPYVIILNQSRNNRDRILKLLSRKVDLID